MDIDHSTGTRTWKSLKMTSPSNDRLVLHPCTVVSFKFRTVAIHFLSLAYKTLVILQVLGLLTSTTLQWQGHVSVPSNTKGRLC